MKRRGLKKEECISIERSIEQQKYFIFLKNNKIELLKKTNKILKILGKITLVFGIILIPVPVPVGFPLVFLGFSMLGVSKTKVLNQIFLFKYRRKSPNFRLLGLKTAKFK